MKTLIIFLVLCASYSYAHQVTVEVSVGSSPSQNGEFEISSCLGQNSLADGVFCAARFLNNKLNRLIARLDQIESSDYSPGQRAVPPQKFAMYDYSSCGGRSHSKVLMGDIVAECRDFVNKNGGSYVDSMRIGNGKCIDISNGPEKWGDGEYTLDRIIKLCAYHLSRGY